MITRIFPVCLLLACVVVLAPTLGHAYCYGTTETQVHCHNDQGCDYIQTVSRCFEQMDGMDNCSVSWGLCCGNPEHWDNASGEICGGPKAPVRAKAGTNHHEDGVAFARLYVPDKCRGGYLISTGVDLPVGR